MVTARIEEDDLQVNPLVNPVLQEIINAQNVNNEKTEKPREKLNDTLHYSSLSSANTPKQVINSKLEASNKTPAKKQNSDPDFFVKSSIAPASEKPLDTLDAIKKNRKDEKSHNPSALANSSGIAEVENKKPKKHINLQHANVELAVKYCDNSHKKIVNMANELQKSFDCQKALLELKANMPKEKGHEFSEKAQAALKKLKEDFKIEFPSDSFKEDPEKLREIINDKLDETRSTIKSTLNTMQVEHTELLQVIQLASQTLNNDESSYIIRNSKG
jgi:ElaB/YqjD/DUF883 family membrane-anchored ribosome-binding protein